MACSTRGSAQHWSEPGTSHQSSGSVGFHYQLIWVCSFALFRTTMSAASIRQRASEVRRLGQYIGLFEWLVWGHFEGINVQMLNGHTATDIRQFLGSELPPRVAEQVCHVAVTRRTEHGKLLVPGLLAHEFGNHYVLCRCLGAPPADLDPYCPPLQDATVAAFRAKWQLRPTNATGDCGPDVMAAVQGIVRSPLGWQVIRHAIAAHMESVQDDPVWQDAYLKCAEVMVQVAPPPLPPPPLPLQSLPPPPVASASAIEGEPCCSASGVVAPSPPANVQNEESRVVAAADASPSVPVANNEPHAGEPPSHATRLSFREWLLRLPQDRLAQVTANHRVFKEAEQQWTKEHPPKKAELRIMGARRKASKVNYKLAVGVQFNRWVETEGASSKSQLKESKASQDTGLNWVSPMHGAVHHRSRGCPHLMHIITVQ